MVGDNALSFFILIFCERADLFKYRSKEVGAEDIGLVLDGREQAFMPHAGIDTHDGQFLKCCLPFVELFT